MGASCVNEFAGRLTALVYVIDCCKILPRSSIPHRKALAPEFFAACPYFQITYCIRDEAIALASVIQNSVGAEGVYPQLVLRAAYIEMQHLYDAHFLAPDLGDEPGIEKS